MATWTDITNAALEPDKPIRSVDGLALRDNPIAIAEGATGAPRIVNEAMADGTLGAEKFQTPASTERDWVLSSTALAGVGAVGTYALMQNQQEIFANPGSTQAGSTLNYSSAAGTSSSTPSGTWRCMGYAERPVDGVSESVSLFLRIA